MSIVNAADAWPSRRETVKISTPARVHCVAAVWRTCENARRERNLRAGDDADVQQRLTITRLLCHTKRAEAARLSGPVLVSAEMKRFAHDVVTALDGEDDW